MCQRVSTADRHFFYFARHFLCVTQNGQKMTQNGQKMTKNGQKMTQNGKKLPKIILNDPKWPRMVQKWPKMAQNGSKGLKRAQKWHFWNVAIYAFCQAQIFCCQAPTTILHPCPQLPLCIASLITYCSLQDTYLFNIQSDPITTCVHTTTARSTKS